MEDNKKVTTFALAIREQPRRKTLYRGVEQLVARQAHNLEVATQAKASIILIGAFLFFIFHTKPGFSSNPKNPILAAQALQLILNKTTTGTLAIEPQ